MIKTSEYRRTHLIPGAAIALAGTLALGACAPAGAQVTASSAQSCASVKRPYPGSRYDDVDLTRIRAAGISCVGARRVVKGAHLRAMGLYPDGKSVRRFKWNGWRVRGDLKGSSDRYTARKGSARISWRF